MLDQADSVKSSHPLNDFFDEIYLVNLQCNPRDLIKSQYWLSADGINFTVFKAIDGYQGIPSRIFSDYMKRPLGQLKRFPQFSGDLLRRGKGFIESPGAIGYILTYSSLIRDAISKGHNSILVLEDDLSPVYNFRSRAKDFLIGIKDEWKVVNLGSSQYDWENVDICKAISCGRYFPSRLATCGSFAIGIHASVFDELLELVGYYDAPFDHLPLGEIYEKYKGYCFSAYPSLVIPDVRSSSIRGPRDQKLHSERMHWPLSHSSFPTPAPHAVFIVSSLSELKRFHDPISMRNQGFFLNIYRRSSDGLRPVHIRLYDHQLSEESPEGNNLSIDRVPLSKYIDCSHLIQNPISHTDVIKALVSSTSSPKSLESNLKSGCHIVKGRVSIVIPTHGRVINLEAALQSCLNQDYSDFEIVVVSDNDDPSLIEQVRKIENIYSRNTFVNFVYHSINRNGAAARNTGVHHSCGEYICFLDDDDIYCKSRVSESVKALSRLGREYGAVYCGYLGWNSPVHDESRFKSGDLTEEILLLDKTSHYLHTDTITIRRETFDILNGFNEAYPRHQDLEFFLRFFEISRIECVSQCLVKIKPSPVPNSNLLGPEQLFSVKKKFLGNFKESIMSRGLEFAADVLASHQREIEFYSGGNDEYCIPSLHDL